MNGTPSNPQQDFADAQALEARGDLAGAEAGYRRLLAAMPGQPVLLARLALLRKAAGAFSEAEGLLRRAIAAAPQEAALHNNLGNVLRNLGRPGDAEASYRKALALQPIYGEAAYNLGVVLEDMKRSDEALDAYRGALELGHARAAVRVRIGAILMQQGSAENALAEIDTAVAADPQAFDAHYYRGLALAQLERSEEAVAALQQAAALRPSSLEAMHSLANNLRATDRHAEALDVYWRMIDLAPFEVTTHNNLNQLAWTTGRRDAFLTSFAYVRDRQGDDPSLMVAEAQLRIQRNDADGAEPLLRKALQVTPERADANAMLGRLLAGRSAFGESYERFEVAVRSDPAAGVFRNEFGYALLKGNEARAALAQFEAARQLNRDDQLALGGLCLAHRALGDSRYAELFDIERFVRVYPLRVPAGFADARAFNNALAEELLKLHTATAEPLDQTLRGGTQTPGLLFLRRLKAVEQVREQIAEAVADYVAAMPAHADHPLLSRKQEAWSFTHSWSCKLRSSGFHTNHVHPMGWISSAYYVSLPDALADHAQRQGWLKFGESHLGLGDDDRPEHFVRPEVGYLVLFPSYFWHGTVPFESAADRLTIAFDVVPGRVDPRTIMAGPY
ncbi:MAG: tetratricopeptide repeat protein [Alphaproteobacteria bacterium]|nr:tetratricopeptide repeat protein [Alphaproteobacteria bacterium]